MRGDRRLVGQNPRRRSARNARASLGSRRRLTSARPLPRRCRRSRTQGGLRRIRRPASKAATVSSSSTRRERGHPPPRVEDGPLRLSGRPTPRAAGFRGAFVRSVVWDVIVGAPCSRTCALPCSAAVFLTQRGNLSHSILILRRTHRKPFLPLSEVFLERETVDPESAKRRRVRNPSRSHLSAGKSLVPAPVSKTGDSRFESWVPPGPRGG